MCVITLASQICYVSNSYSASHRNCVRLARNMMNARPSRLQFVDGEKVLVHPTSESDSVQHAVDEGDLEAVTAWMAVWSPVSAIFARACRAACLTSP